MTTIKEYTTDELLLIAHNVTCEYSPQKVRRAKRELYARGVTDKVIADIIEEEEAAFDRRLEAAARAEQKREDERNEKNRCISYPHPQMACLFFFAPFYFVHSIRRFNYFAELRRLKEEKYDLMFKQRLWLLIGGDLAWGVWAFYKHFWGGGL